MTSETNTTQFTVTFRNEKDYTLTLDGVEMNARNLMDEEIRQKVLSAPRIFFGMFGV
ncbi:MAG: hypothetical protein HKM93_04280 [Desulfobacteraceae bacterium]|nr:hypothetical protein [Desulfobacteraceae bacterium]